MKMQKTEQQLKRNEREKLNELVSTLKSNFLTEDSEEKEEELISKLSSQVAEFVSNASEIVRFQHQKFARSVMECVSSSDKISSEFTNQMNHLKSKSFGIQSVQELASTFLNELINHFQSNFPSLTSKAIELLVKIVEWYLSEENKQQKSLQPTQSLQSKVDNLFAQIQILSNVRQEKQNQFLFNCFELISFV
jgi:hypothetical protein